VGLNSLKSLNLTNVYPNNKKNNNNNKTNNNKVKSKPLELFELAGKNRCPTRENHVVILCLDCTVILQCMCSTQWLGSIPHDAMCVTTLDVDMCST
jgi:hypothetical protein